MITVVYLNNIIIIILLSMLPNKKEITMKQLRRYLFSKIKKDPPVWYYTENIDAKMSEFTVSS